MTSSAILMRAKAQRFTNNKLAVSLILSLSLGACGGGSEQTQNEQPPTADVPAPVVTPAPAPDPVPTPEPAPDPVTPTPSEFDEALAVLIDQFDLAVSPSQGRELPDIESPIAQLGKKLFFSKSLGGAFDSACVSCHHPSLGGADELSLPIGVDAIEPDLLGQGRVNSTGLPIVPRNSPTVVNSALWDTSLFWDSRVESSGKEVGQNGAASAISTPDSGFGIADNNAGANLVAAQARFPVTSSEEMKTEAFEAGSSNQQIRHHLAARLGDYAIGAGELALNAWLEAFQQGFNSSDGAEQLITFDNIAHALAEYERSMVFINSPWRDYVTGNLAALTDEQKQGALLFFQGPEQGGAGCAACHNGPLFSDGQHHTVAFPQIGPGKGDGISGDDDFGRERVTGNAADRYRFRTPSLLNIALTAPYGHAGSYDSLTRVVRHYNNPGQSAQNYAQDADWCELEQFELVSACQDLYPNTLTHAQSAAAKLGQERRNGTSRLPQINLNNEEVAQLVAFLNSLTDPCLTDRACLAPWIADANTDDPDGQLLIATDINGEVL